MHVAGAALEVCESQAAPPLPDELMLIVQVDPTAPGADVLAQGAPSRRPFQRRALGCARSPGPVCLPKHTDLYPIQ